MKYNIHCGLTSTHYVGTAEFETRDEALDYAYELAVEEYESYAGYHGIPSWGELEEEVREFYCNDEEYDEEDIESMTLEAWNESIESWVQYYVIPTDEDDVDAKDIVLI